MSRLYKCDLCGKVVEENENRGYGYQNVNQAEIKFTKGITQHVCVSCQKAYKDYDDKITAEYNQRLVEFADKMREKAGITKPVEKASEMDMPLEEK